MKFSSFIVGVILTLLKVISLHQVSGQSAVGFPVGFISGSLWTGRGFAHRGYLINLKRQLKVGSALVLPVSNKSEVATCSIGTNGNAYISSLEPAVTIVSLSSTGPKSAYKIQSSIPVSIVQANFDGSVLLVADALGLGGARLIQVATGKETKVASNQRCSAINFCNGNRIFVSCTGDEKLWRVYYMALNSTLGVRLVSVVYMKHEIIHMACSPAFAEGKPYGFLLLLTSNHRLYAFKRPLSSVAASTVVVHFPNPNSFVFDLLNKQVIVSSGSPSRLNLPNVAVEFFPYLESQGVLPGPAYYFQSSTASSHGLFCPLIFPSF